MSIAMWQEIKALKARVEALEKRPALAPVPVAIQADVKKPERKMCPKCGDQPAHFFHVKYCKADKKNNNGPTEKADG